MPSETIELRGHIIDSLILPKVLDEIITHGGSFKIVEIKIGEGRADQSFARIEVTGPKADELDDLILRLRQHGAEVVEKKSVELAAAPADGVFPEHFYVTTNQQTFVQLDDGEIEVRPALMDSAIVVDRAARHRDGDEVLRDQKRRCRWSSAITESASCRCNVPVAAPTFSSSWRATSRSKNRRPPSSERWRAEFQRAREENGKILVVGGPAIVHTGAVEHFEKLIEWGFVNLLFAGNALAAHDIENALFGTSLGVFLEKGSLAESGHENHMRAINVIRCAGGIRPAVKNGLLKSGIMFNA